MRIALDTNVLVSATVFGGAPRAVLALAIEGTARLVVSRVLMDEYERVLHAKFGFSARAARETRNEVESMSDLIDPDPVPATSRVHDDDNVLAAAVAGMCDAIVSGDDDLLALGSFRGIRIVTPREFLDLSA